MLILGRVVDINKNDKYHNKTFLGRMIDNQIFQEVYDKYYVKTFLGDSLCLFGEE